MNVDGRMGGAADGGLPGTPFSAPELVGALGGATEAVPVALRAWRSARW